MGDTEEYFPRGGKKPTTTYFKQSANFLGAPEKSEKKKKKPKKRSEGDDGYLSDEGTKEIDQSFKNCALGLSYKTVKEGLLILGRVKNVLETKIFVSLPCRLIGSIMACHISEPYNKELEAYVNDKTDKVLELSQMFRPGQYVAVKVLEVKELSLMLSVMPQHVNGQTLLKDLQKGNLIQAAVSSVEDHGYVMDIGVPDTTAFLPKTNTNPELELDVGMVCWCTIKSSPSPGGGVVTLSNELVALQNSWLRHKTSGPMLPGSNLDFLVDTPLENGIEGHVFGDTTAYVQRQHADSVRGKKPTLGQKIRARLLYVMPTRNTPFLTMRNIFDSTYPDLGAEQQLKDGQIIEEAQVLKITGRSIHFRLGGGCFGTMSLKRIQVDEDLTDEEVVAKSYPIGSAHKVRVLCYNLSDYVYSVTDQPDVVSEKYFNFEQLRSGELVDATVKTVADNHVLLNVGRVTGYVSQAHLFDSGILVDKKASTSKLPKKKYRVGQAVKARVLVVDPGRQTLFLTLKPSLLSPDLQVLDSYEKAVIGKSYTGVIKTIKDFILVSFFNNVIAYIPRQFISKEPLENIAQAFHIGQIVNCTILRVNAEEKKMSGSFTTQPFTQNAKKEKPNKRKTTEDDDVPNKKTKTEKTQVKEKKKKQSTEAPTEESNTEDNPDQDSTRKKKKSKLEQTEEITQEPVSKKVKKKKAKQNIEEQQKAEPEEDETPAKKKRNKKKERKESKSEESDAIETDFDLETVLNPNDAVLIDMTKCTTAKHYAKKVSSLLKSIDNRSKRIAKIGRKIAKLEKKGLNSQTKLFHTAMQTDRIIVKERINRLMQALEVAQAKLKEFGVGVEFKQEYKKEKKSGEKGTEKVENEKKRDKLEVKVVESLEPALEAPSAQEFWSAGVDSLTKTVQVEEDSSSEDEEKDQPKKKRKKLSVAEKLAKVREEEERVREMERRATESENQPQSSEQFERALLANPNSSQLWIAYMAFYLQATEVDKARKIGRRGLSTVSFREPLEKFNISVALLSIECRFGTKESLQKTLEEALQTNEPFDIHSKLLNIYVETGKHQELVALVDLMMRKYKRETKMYGLCGAACFKLGLVDKARQVMQKAISVLEKKEHVPVLVQFALLESRSGSRERAEALFEQLLAVYPARVDVASTYLDVLLKTSDHDHVRQVLERMTSQKLPARKMKVLYKKWIEIEEKIGDQEQVDKIRQRAMEYIEKAKF